MEHDLKIQLDELQKKVKAMEDVLGTDAYGREKRITGLFTIENSTIYRMVADDATVSTNARYGEISVNAGALRWLDSAGTNRWGGNFTPTTLIISGAIPSDVSYVQLNDDTPLIAATIAVPEAGRLLVITQIDTGTAGHTVTLTAGTYDGSATIATFNAQYETLVLFGVSATRFVIIQNIGAVALS